MTAVAVCLGRGRKPGHTSGKNGADHQTAAQGRSSTHPTPSPSAARLTSLLWTSLWTNAYALESADHGWCYRLSPGRVTRGWRRQVWARAGGLPLQRLSHLGVLLGQRGLDLGGEVPGRLGPALRLLCVTSVRAPSRCLTAMVRSSLSNRCPRVAVIRSRSTCDWILRTPEADPPWSWVK